MSGISTYWLEPTDQVCVSLRRFTGYDAATHNLRRPCPTTTWGCDASTVIAAVAPKADWPDAMGDHPDVLPHDDPRWPRGCEACGHPFDAADRWQLRTDALWSGHPSGALSTLRDAPVGAMWNAAWMATWHRGPDGLCLVVKTPGGEWMVDSRASNCDQPDRPHQCWIRHGDPRTGPVTVDKQGDTCHAGAGSILIGGYHGFLRNGALVSA